MFEKYIKKASAIRFLSACMVDKAQSGHVGMPLGMADVAAVLWSDFLNYSNLDTKWPNRDRFILSCGHGSALLYSILYLMKIITLDDCKKFRKIGSITPGHPEYGLGVEMTTGPLGQGLAWGIGMCKASFNYPELDHYTYIFCSDGDLMEGISHESLALASLWNLSKCIVFWDDNQITIDGEVNLSSSNNLVNLFSAHNWNIIQIDGHNYAEIKDAIISARASDKPTCIRCKTIIGYGSEAQGSAKAHGTCIKDMEQFKSSIDMNYPNFELPSEYLSLWDESIERGNLKYKQWQNYNFQYRKDLKLKLDFEPNLTKYCSTRSMIAEIVKHNPDMVVGSADLGESTYTKDHANYIHFGVREHGMIATAGGMSLYGERVAVATFLSFTDYARPAIRLAAIMGTKITIIATHDSIAVGEDGPTHQPIEQLSSYRLMPNTLVFRPANWQEMKASWILADAHEGPSIMACTRQNIINFDSDLNDCLKGAYVVKACDKSIVTLVATGSEVELAIQCQEELSERGIASKVVSMLSVEIFEKQSFEYKKNLLTDFVVSIEAGSSGLWYKYADLCIGIDEFGESGSAKEVIKSKNFTKEMIVQKIMFSMRHSS